MPRTINREGAVAGSFDTRASLIHGAAYHHACIWLNGKLRDLGKLGGPESEALALNDRGDVVGDSDAPRSDGGRGFETHAFIVHDGRMAPLPAPRGWWSVAFHINNHGVVVGYWQPPGGSERAVMWVGGAAVPLAQGPDDSRATGVNDRGVVCGFRDRPGSQSRVAFVRDGKREWWIPRINYSTSVDPDAPVLINNRDQLVVGGEYSIGSHNGIGSSSGQMIREERTRPFLLGIPRLK